MKTQFRGVLGQVDEAPLDVKCPELLIRGARGQLHRLAGDGHLAPVAEELLGLAATEVENRHQVQAVLPRHVAPLAQELQRAFVRRVGEPAELGHEQVDADRLDPRHLRAEVSDGHVAAADLVTGDPVVALGRPGKGSQGERGRADEQ